MDKGGAWEYIWVGDSTWESQSVQPVARTVVTLHPKPAEEPDEKLYQLTLTERIKMGERDKGRETGLSGGANHSRGV